MSDEWDPSSGECPDCDGTGRCDCEGCKGLTCLLCDGTGRYA